MRKLILSLSVCCMCVLSGVTAAQADSFTLTFDETPPGTVSITNPTPAAGVSPFLSFRGITFGFQASSGLLSADARYGATGPGNFTAVQGRVLEGDATGILTLNFDVPTRLLNFGVGLTSPNNLAPGFTVELFNPSLSSLGITNVNTTRLSTLPLSEGLFSYTGAPISRAVINFNDALLTSAPRRFALDNLTADPIPEPATMVLLSIGLAGVAASIRRHRRRNADAS